MSNPIPASLTAEQSVLGSVLQVPDLAARVFVVARPEMFWEPRHAALAATLVAMHDAAVPIDPQTVLARLIASGDVRRLDGAYLLTLIQRAWQPANALTYAEEVRECYRRRMVGQAAERITQQIGNPEVETETLVVELAGVVDLAQDLATAREPVRPATLDDLLAGSDEQDWVVPGLIARRERTILTGFEGLGKSELAAQVAVAAAAGIHPFTGQPIEPHRVLVVDLENGDYQMRCRYRRIDAIVAAIGGAWDHARLMVEIRDEGIDLRQGDDVAWLDRLLTAARPDLMCIGPLYKMHRDRMEDEQAARLLAHTLDTMRVRHNCALLIEAHSGHAEEMGGRRKVRPRGSSLFLGWPNVGIGLRPHQDAVDMERPNLVEVKHWRGAREVREWPRVLARSGDGAYGLPWTAYTPTTADKAAARLRRAELEQGGAA
jgi:hypothetical protein